MAYAIPDGRVAMNAVLRSGFGTSGGSVTSLNFQPDFIWEKRRNTAVASHFLIDSVRGISKNLSSYIILHKQKFQIKLITLGVRFLNKF